MSCWINMCSLRNATTSCVKAPCSPVEVDCGSPIEGQLYTKCGSACPQTCGEPKPRICTLQCVAGCQCPNGTALNEENYKCAKVDKCPALCPPVRTHEYCSKERNRNKPCSRYYNNIDQVWENQPCQHTKLPTPPPHSISACPDRCYSTYCRACYYSNRQRRTPRQHNGEICRNHMKPACVRNWTKCIYRENHRKNKCRRNCACITAENFRCYEYPSCNNLRG